MPITASTPQTTALVYDSCSKLGPYFNTVLDSRVDVFLSAKLMNASGLRKS
jgi:hypothetical protein